MNEVIQHLYRLLFREEAHREIGDADLQRQIDDNRHGIESLRQQMDSDRQAGQVQQIQQQARDEQNARRTSIAQWCADNIIKLVIAFLTTGGLTLLATMKGCTP